MINHSRFNLRTIDMITSTNRCLWIERIVQVVADEVDSHNAKQDADARRDPNPPGAPTTAAVTATHWNLFHTYLDVSAVAARS
jgi:hypothetical protein